MGAQYLVGDVFDRIAELPDGSVDVIVTSPPFLALRSYLPADHPDKGREIGSEATPAEFLDVMFRLSAEWRRVLAPHGSIAVELGDTYSGSGGAGGDYNDGGLREGQQAFSGSARKRATNGVGDEYRPSRAGRGSAWPEAKSKTLIPELYRIGLAYGLNPLTGTVSPAGRWRVRNVVTWCRPNPPVGALGDKWRPATSDVVVACLSDKRYWDDLATRRPHSPNTHARTANGVGTRPNDLPSGQRDGNWDTLAISDESNPAGAPLLDWWEIPPGGYSGAHYAVYPPALVEPLIAAMCPQRVCTTCGEPSRRLVANDAGGASTVTTKGGGLRVPGTGDRGGSQFDTGEFRTLGWSDCGHDTWRPGVVLDPFGGSGTTGMVATGRGHDAILIDLDERNADLAVDRIGPLLLEVEYPNPTRPRVP